ncbi:acyl-CoA-like ligand-binding transcription factor [Glycomyces arizonensis]|uniref:acyl-CoA-like ligand-binding transcription factor n=1 Tax=Glycomyces arizonensis TaxID=256035 RepID=UPI000407BA19|nr:TetR family transcriptional regulator [Glycomyces arizonensis]
MADQTGLRERKKAATKAALSQATLRLSVEKGGIDAVIADDIAAAAGVSTRTFHNYFPSKEAALLYDFNELVAQMIGALRERVRDRPVWDALRDACISMRIDERFDLELLQCREQLIHGSPSLISYQATQFVAFFTEALGIVAEATGSDEDDMYPRLVLGAALLSMKVANEHWLAHPDRPLDEVIAEAFANFETGLARPHDHAP